MSLPGWYPDPAGTPSRYRYWDGRAWSHDTTDNPAATPPGGSPPPTGEGPGSGSGRRKGPLILALSVLVVLVLVGVFVVRGLTGNRELVDPPGPLPSSTVSGWDDSSPEPPPETITPSDPPPATPTPTPSPTEDLPVQPCPQGEPTTRQDHPADGRIHGGGLSFSEISGWQPMTTQAGYEWAYDVAGQQKQIEPKWIASMTVGAVFTGDGFDEPRRAAELVMECMITSGFYGEHSERADLWSKAVTVDGRPAWSVRAEVQIDTPDVRAKGDIVEVIVVDTDAPETLAMFIGAVTIGDKALAKNLDATIKNLRVE